MQTSKKLFIAAFSLIMAVAGAIPARAQDVDADVIADGLRNPWGLDFLPDGGAVVTERPGQMRLLVDGRLSDPINGVPKVAARGQGGLLDIAISPRFTEDSLVFFSFSEPGSGGAGTAVARAKLVRDGGDARLEDVTTIFSMNRKTGTTRHFGSRLVFSPDGTLFITTGDRGDGKRAQNMRDHAGAVIRINTDGTVPADNPKPEGWLPELWSKGHRNIQGAAIDPATGTLLTVEHGAKGGDEINRPEAGKNYGWPVISYGMDYSGDKIGVGTEAPGYEQPLHYWDPSIAPSGMAVYDGGMFSEWKGDLLIGSLKFAYLAHLDRDASGGIGEETRLVEDEFGRIRDVNVAPDGSIWLLTDQRQGAIVRLSRAD
ncbi:PQQ-dependent sugar dehydrogenase [Mesorhizobium sp. CN2-181]|uniref:PQQ-dependent sugar dehydrogenase n=1 Tax=Mesorhizobium yinganensis TaxID=3157707 RepID=UPI0032B7B5E9